jgi:hypothetical protein
MFFGLPWFAIVAIVAIAGGMIYAYKEKELEMEEKRLGSSRELNELRKIVHNLKSRVENLEAIASEEKKRETSPLGEIEFEEGETVANDAENSSRSGNKMRTK